MTHKLIRSQRQFAQEYAHYKQQVDALKREQEELLAQIREELEEKKKEELHAKIARD